MNYWLLKTEPSTFDIDALAQLPNQVTAWEGVRNYQARNMLRDEMQIGDLAFFYHSSCAVPGIVGVVTVIKTGYPDDTAWDPCSPYYDATSSRAQPRWFRVDVQLVCKFAHMITLPQLRQNPKLQDLVLLRKGNRLSVMPVTLEEWTAIKQMALMDF